MVELPKLLRVKWYDAWSADWWLPAEDARKLTPIACYTVGYILSECGDAIILSQTYNDQDHVNNTFIIPKQMVLEVQEIGNSS